MCLTHTPKRVHSHTLTRAHAAGPTARAHEAALYRSCGAASLAGTAFADPSPDALPESGGAVAAFAFGAAADD